MADPGHTDRLGREADRRATLGAERRAALWADRGAGSISREKPAIPHRSGDRGGANSQTSLLLSGVGS